jgi:3-methyladenine DNA glycosylase AlkD
VKTKHNTNKEPTANELPPPEEYMSDMRYIVHHAKGEPFNPLPDYANAKEAEHGCVIIEGDYGGQIYLTCPMKYVKCSHDELVTLAHDLDRLYWDDDNGCNVYYEEYESPHGISGSMGGGNLIDGLWLHPDFDGIQVKNRVLAVINGEQNEAKIDVFDAFRYNRNAERAVKMSAYMRDQFPFLGIPTPRRKELSKRYLKIDKKSRPDWDFVFRCWEQPEREFQYLAVEYLSKVKTVLAAGDIPNMQKLIISKSWWDTTDGLDVIVGDIALCYPEVNETLLEWSKDDNFWLRRVAIDHQLTRKDKTDTALLEQIIMNNFEQTEFFVNKAIGWSLRDYSKTNPGWVKNFIERHRSDLAPLSIREGSKYLTDSKQSDY